MLGTLVIALGILEFANLVFADLDVAIRARVKTVFLCTQFAALSCVMMPRLVFSPFPAAILVVGVSVMFWMLHRSQGVESLHKILNQFLLGFLYLPVLSMSALVLLHSPEGAVHFWFMICTVAVTDMSAYVSGLLFGKEKLSPQISPKKSWVGFWGGLIGAVCVGFIFASLRPESVTLHVALIVSLVGSLASQTGDLFESLLKRHLNVKDSGSLIPGHGGILDRLDGILFAAPVFAAAFLF